MACFEGLAADRRGKPGAWPPSRAHPFDHQRHPVAASLRDALERCSAQVRQLDTIYRRFRRWSEAGVWEAVSVTQAEIIADRGHYSIDSTTVRAHVSAAGEKGGLIDELLATRGAGSPVSFTV
jgi:transposase